VFLGNQDLASYPTSVTGDQTQKHWLAWIGQWISAGVALKRRGSLESVVHRKGARHVRRRAVGDVPCQGNALAAYPTFLVRNTPTGLLVCSFCASEYSSHPSMDAPFCLAEQKRYAGEATDANELAWNE
jgi:hypothetical protein